MVKRMDFIILLANGKAIAMISRGVKKIGRIGLIHFQKKQTLS